MDIAKFLRLLEMQSLWFSRADCLEDPREAGMTDSERERFDVASRPAELLARTTNFLCCWRAGNDESMAMWDIYGKGGATVAIKSTIGRLKEVVATLSRPVFIAEVRYVDWQQTPPAYNMLVWCVRKALSYRHESEVRMVIWAQDIVEKIFDKWDASQNEAPPKSSFAEVRTTVPLGLDIPVDLDKLITEVAVGPREPSWIGVLVQDILQRYRVQKPVVISDLLKPRP